MTQRPAHDPAEEVSQPPAAATTRSRPAPSPPLDFEAVVDRYQSPLLRYARQLGCGAEESEDVVQEAFLRLHRQVLKDGGEGLNHLSSWLFRVTHNLARDAGRKKGRQQNAQQYMVERDMADPARSMDVIDGLTDLVQRDATQRAMVELGRLPEHQRQVVLLKIIEGQKLREIADVTGTSIGNVSYRLNQGLAAMARRLKKAGVI